MMINSKIRSLLILLLSPTISASEKFFHISNLSLPQTGTQKTWASTSPSPPFIQLCWPESRAKSHGRSTWTDGFRNLVLLTLDYFRIRIWISGHEKTALPIWLTDKDCWKKILIKIADKKLLKKLEVKNRIIDVDCFLSWCAPIIDEIRQKVNFVSVKTRPLFSSIFTKNFFAQNTDGRLTAWA